MKQEIVIRELFSDLLNSAKEAAGLTQEELAFRAGISDRQYRRIVSGVSSPTLETIIALLAAGEIKMEDFMAYMVCCVELARKEQERNKL